MKKSEDNQKGWMNAITFAEAGEWATAIAMLPEGRGKRAFAWLQETSMAAAFAEEGMSEEALRIMNSQAPQANSSADAFMNSIGLGGIRMTYGVCAV